MKNLKPIIFRLAVPALFLILVSMTNDARNDLQKIGLAYKNLKLLSVDIRYILFTDHQSSKIQEEKTGHSVVAKNLYYNEFGNVEIFRDGKLAVVADHSRKVLVLKKIDKLLKNDAVPMNLDSALSNYKTVNYKKINEEQGQYTLELKKGKIEKLVIVFNTQSYLIDMVDIFYKDILPESGQSQSPPRVEIQYKNHTGLSKKDAGVSVKKFFDVSKGKYIPKGIYKDFQFINYLSR